MENPIKMDDLGENPPFKGNIQKPQTNLVEAAPSASLSPTSSGTMEVAGAVMWVCVSALKGLKLCGVKGWVKLKHKTVPFLP